MHLPETDAVTHLRSRTRDAHTALENSDLILPATRERAKYSRLIGAMLSFHRAVEEQFRRFERELTKRGLLLHGCYKTVLLEEESAALNSPIVARPSVEFDSAAHAAGGVYVMEGSTLGGMLIAKSVLEHQSAPSRYYGCYGRATAERWRVTREQLNAFASAPAELDAMIDGANTTFASLHRHLLNVLQPA